MATAIPFISAIGSVLGVVNSAKTLFGGNKAPAAPVVEAPKVMPTQDTAKLAALDAKKRAAASQGAGRASTLLSSTSSDKLGA